MDTFAKRLRYVRKLRGMSQEELSEKSGVAQPVISKIERGLISQTRGLIALAMALKCSPYWLEYERGEMDDTALTELVETIRAQDASNQPPALANTAQRATKSIAIDLDNNPEYPAIRRVALKAQAGVSGYAVEYMNDDGPPVVFRKDWYTAHNYQPEKMLAMRVHGESMVPSLYAGDLIILNTAQVQPKDGIAFVVAYEGEIVVKRLVRDEGQWWLTSDNPDQRRYPRKKCNGDTQIIGEVIYRQTERI